MTVKVYSTPNCPWCTLAKDFLKENNIEFESIDVTQDQEALDRVVEKTGQIGVPVIEIDGRFVIGFDKPELAEIFKIKI